MLRDFKNWLNKDKTGIEVYDFDSQRFYSRVLTVREENVINSNRVVPVEEQPIEEV